MELRRKEMDAKRRKLQNELEARERSAAKKEEEKSQRMIFEVSRVRPFVF